MPSRLILRLLVVFTGKLEILVTTLITMHYEGHPYFFNEISTSALLTDPIFLQEHLTRKLK